MNRHSIATLIASTALMITATALIAHHSGAEWDRTKPVTVQGVVKEVKWENPHSWLYVDVKDESGKVVTWGFEFANGARAVREGLNPVLLKAGTPITVTGSRARDASRPLASIVEITYVDGKKWSGGPIRVKGSGPAPGTAVGP